MKRTWSASTLSSQSLKGITGSDMWSEPPLKPEPCEPYVPLPLAVVPERWPTLAVPPAVEERRGEDSTEGDCEKGT